jgi:hypothetical protein
VYLDIYDDIVEGGGWWSSRPSHSATRWDILGSIHVRALGKFSSDLFLLSTFSGSGAHSDSGWQVELTTLPS